MKRFLLVALGAIMVTPSFAGIFYTVRESDDVLQRFDTTTLTSTDVGALGVAFAFGDLAYDSGSGTMYMVGGRDNNGLYTVDLNTGAATLVGMHGFQDMFGLAYDPTTGGMFSSQFSNGTGFFEMNKNTGVATEISTQGSGIGGMVVKTTTNELLGINDGSGNIFSIDRVTGNQTFLGNGGTNDDSGLGWDVETGLLWNIDWAGNLYTYDGAFNRTLMLSGLGAHDGLAFVTAVPEPASMLALGAGIAALLRRRRKQS